MKKLKKDEPKKYQPQMTKETKQTALEQFAIALYEKGLLIGNGDWMQDVLQEFKEIEKQEMIEFANDLLAQNDINYIGVPNLAEQYYEQTYGGGEQ
jgi:hypothetical protein